jgi:NADP-reducing hydrogenase subunit HndA
MTTAQATACSDPAALPEEVRRFAAERLGGPRARSVLIPTLHLLQNTVGYLRDDHMAEVARMFGISPNEVRGVASFYHFFSFEPKGKHPISVCTGTACHVRGAAAVLHQIKTTLGVEEGERTEDGLFSIGCARCIGMCAMAPVVTAGDRVYGSVTTADVERMLADHGHVPEEKPAKGRPRSAAKTAQEKP